MCMTLLTKFLSTVPGIANGVKLYTRKQKDAAFLPAGKNRHRWAVNKNPLSRDYCNEFGRSKYSFRIFQRPEYNKTICSVRNFTIILTEKTAFSSSLDLNQCL